jgi:membrane protein required for colicin V production
MTPYDAAMLGVVVAGMIWGAWRGITWQVASIASLVLGYSVAHPLSAQLAPHFPGEPVVARALAMLAIYAAVSCGVFLVAWLIRTTLRQLRFEAFDRHLGMVLGGLEGALLGMVGTLFVTSLAPQTREPIFHSTSGRVVAHVMDTVGPVLPGEIRTAIMPSWAHVAAVADPGPGRDDDAAEARPVSTGSVDRNDRRWDGRRAPEAARDGNADGPGLVQGVGQALEQAIDKGDASTLRDAVKQGRSRLGKAVGEAVEREINRVGDADGRNPDRR